MFRLPIVFVLGAGSSKEAGLPLGTELRDRLANAVEFHRDHRDDDLRRLLSRGAEHNKWQEIVAAGAKLASNVGRFNSVDEALHFWRTEPGVVELGKRAIALLILKSERESSLAQTLGAAFEHDRLIDTWFSTFLRMAVNGLAGDQLPTLFQNVRVINFNYDRVLEEYLYRGLIRYYMASPDVALAALQGMKVIRPYGSLGKLPWQDEKDGIEFGANPDSLDLNKLSKLASSIRTFTEEVTDSAANIEMKNALHTARMIVFMGFGFHRQNVQLLSSAKIMVNGPGLASAYGWSDPHNISAIHNDLLRLANSASTMNAECAQFLEIKHAVIMQAVG